MVVNPVVFTSLLHKGWLGQTDLAIDLDCYATYYINCFKGLCDYLIMMDYHHLALDIDEICMTYQSGLNGCHGSGYADSVLHEFFRTLAQPSGTFLFVAS